MLLEIVVNIAISSIGTATPPHRQSQTKVADFMAAKLQLNATENRQLKKVYQATGVEYRYSVLEDFNKLPDQTSFFPSDPHTEFPNTLQRMKIYEQYALPLALTAIQSCLTNISLNKTAITHLITVSCTGMSAPGLDIAIVKNFGLRSATHRTAINFMGCYGAFNGIKMAHAICKSDPVAVVLVVSLELCTLHFQDKHSIDNFVSSALFADGCAAAIVQTEPDAAKFLRLEHFHCDLIPESSQEMTWAVGAQGFDIVLSSYVPKLIGSGIADFMKTLFAKAALHIDDIAYFAIHPGSKKILEACEDALGISREHNRYSYEVLRQYGNMSSATVLFILKNILDDVNASDNQSNIFSCAFGPGLTIESMLLRLQHV
jgi:alpha-pyrone synthase